MTTLGTLMTPRIDAKIRNRLFSSRWKNKRPDFKDLLRERFKNKIRANRQSLIQKFRAADDSKATVQDTLNSYLHMEIAEFSKLDSNENDGLGSSSEHKLNLEDELQLMQEVEAELLEEQLNWITQEYQKEEEEIRGVVLCPLCQRGFLRKSTNEVIQCSVCPIQVCSSASLEQVDHRLELLLNEHTTNCKYTPEFTVINEPSSSGLFIICHKCFAFNQIC